MLANLRAAAAAADADSDDDGDGVPAFDADLDVAGAHVDVGEALGAVADAVGAQAAAQQAELDEPALEALGAPVAALKAMQLGPPPAGSGKQLAA